MFRDLPHNTRITLLLEPYCSVLACILTFYAALYMQANGLDARQIGLIATLAAVTGLLNQCAAALVDLHVAPIADGEMMACFWERPDGELVIRPTNSPDSRKNNEDAYEQHTKPGLHPRKPRAAACLVQQRRRRSGGARISGGF